MSKISQRLEQKLKLSPRQILEANIVQLNFYNLEKKIVEELESNPILEIEDEVDENIEQEENEDSFDLEELDSNPEDFEIVSNSNKEKNIENAKSLNEKNLTDDFISQLYDINYSEEKIDIALEILGNLDERGYLTIEPQLISDRLNLSLSNINDVILDIKSLDPPGVASLSMQDCILSQLKFYYPEKKMCKKIIENCFDDFVNKKFKKIINKIECSEEELLEASQIISVLNPVPAINYTVSTNEHIIPDIMIEYSEAKWNVLLNEPQYSGLKINRYYSGLLKNKKNSEVSNFIKKKIDSAIWFIDAIKQRSITIKKVTESIINHQKKYFTFEEDRELDPMILEDIANDINMDISTVSRVTNGKYVQMPWGVKELKAFFTVGIKMKNGKEVSNTILKKELIKLIDNEDKQSPFTDDQLAEILNNKGYLIARRTVAKYRELLKFPTSRLRKTII
mgnify:CR=1 FL=1